jgi:hypothetical protein
MRKEVLGLLAWVASGSLAFAQYVPGNYGPAPGEPIPIQGSIYPPAGQGAYLSPFPSYAPPTWQSTEMPAPAYGMTPYSMPPSGMAAGMPGAFVPAAAQQAVQYPSAYVPSGVGPGYPRALPSAPGYVMPPFAGADVPFPGASPVRVPGMPTSQGNPAAAPAAPPEPLPPPLPPDRDVELLPDPSAPSSAARTQGAIPSEPYLFAQSGAGVPDEPYFQQVDPWRSVRGSRMYGYLDYLLWWTKQQSLPAVSTLPNVDLASQFGTLTNDPRSGVRGTFGGWITPMKDLAWEASTFYLGEQLVRNTLDLGASPPSVTTLPFFFGINSQSSEARLTSRLWGVETNLRYQFCCFKTDDVQWFFDVIGGIRYLDLSEGIGVQTNSQFAVAPVLLSGASVTSVDNFFTHNNFYGGQVGGDINVYCGRFNVNLFGKVALGDNVETVNISGATSVVTPLTTQVLTGGFLTAPSNIGHHTRNVFAVIPETGVNLHFRVCHYCQLGIGYSFLYFSRVARPGDQISTVTNGTLLPAGLSGATAQPLFTSEQSHFWATGINARIMFIF